MVPMRSHALRRSPIYVVALMTAIGAAAALAIAHGSEIWDGLVPCALCLLQRWPYRIVIILALVAALAPRHFSRLLLLLAALCLLADAAIAAVHVGVEQRWWPSPLPECAAPRFTGGSIEERLGGLAARPQKPRWDASHPMPGPPPPP